MMLGWASKNAGKSGQGKNTPIIALGTRIHLVAVDESPEFQHVPAPCVENVVAPGEDILFVENGSAAVPSDLTESPHYEVANGLARHEGEFRTSRTLPRSKRDSVATKGEPEGVQQRRRENMAL